MEQIERYRSIVRAVIERHAQFKPSVGDIETEVIFDEKNDHYELMHTGWVHRRRVQGPVIHVDIRGGKIWVQHDGTSSGVVDEFLDAGVPPEHIVLAFHAPDVRQHTGFAVA